MSLLLAFIPTPELVTADRWHQPWPAIVRPAIAPQHAVALMVSGIGAFVPVVATAAAPVQLYAPFADPYRRTASSVGPDLASAPIQQTATATPNGWFVAWDRPSRRGFAPSTWNGDNPFGMTLAETVWPSSWHQPMAAPTQVKGLPASLQSAAAFVYAPAAAVTVSIGWAAPLSEPVRANALTSAQRQASNDNPFGLTQPEIVTQSRWHLAWADPVRIKPLPAGAQQSLAFAQSPPFTETVSLDRWNQTWRDPVRVRRALANDGHVGVGVTVSQPVPVGWVAAFNDPARKVASTGLRQDASSFVALQIAAPVQVMAWHMAWADPSRGKPSLLTALQNSVSMSQSLVPVVRTRVTFIC